MCPKIEIKKCTNLFSNWRDQRSSRVSSRFQPIHANESNQKNPVCRIADYLFSLYKKLDSQKATYTWIVSLGKLVVLIPIFSEKRLKNKKFLAITAGNLRKRGLLSKLKGLYQEICSGGEKKCIHFSHQMDRLPTHLCLIFYVQNNLRHILFMIFQFI